MRIGSGCIKHADGRRGQQDRRVVRGADVHADSGLTAGHGCTGICGGDNKYRVGIAAELVDGSIVLLEQVLALVGPAGNQIQRAKARALAQVVSHASDRVAASRAGAAQTQREAGIGVAKDQRAGSGAEAVGRAGVAVSKAHGSSAGRVIDAGHANGLRYAVAGAFLVGRSEGDAALAGARRVAAVVEQNRLARGLHQGVGGVGRKAQRPGSGVAGRCRVRRANLRAAGHQLVAAGIEPDAAGTGVGCGQVKRVSRLVIGADLHLERAAIPVGVAIDIVDADAAADKHRCLFGKCGGAGTCAADDWRAVGPVDRDHDVVRRAVGGCHRKRFCRAQGSATQCMQLVVVRGIGPGTIGGNTKAAVGSRRAGLCSHCAGAVNITHHQGAGRNIIAAVFGQRGTAAAAEGGRVVAARDGHRHQLRGAVGRSQRGRVGVGAVFGKLIVGVVGGIGPHTSRADAELAVAVVAGNIGLRRKQIGRAIDIGAGESAGGAERCIGLDQAGGAAAADDGRIVGPGQIHGKGSRRCVAQAAV